MGAHYHGPEVAPDEFPEQEEETGGEVAFDIENNRKQDHLWMDNSTVN